MFSVAKHHLNCFWSGWNWTLIKIFGDKLPVSHSRVKATAEKKPENSQNKIVSQSFGNEGKTNDNCIVLDVLLTTFLECVSVWAWKLGLGQCAAHCSVRLQCLETHQTLVFSSSVTALRVSGKRAWRRKSLSSSTQLTLSPPSPNCPSLSPSSTTAPWTSRRRRSLTSLRRWWWVVACFAQFAQDTNVSVGLLLQPFDLAAKKYHIHGLSRLDVQRSLGNIWIFGHALPLSCCLNILHLISQTRLGTDGCR